MSFIAERISYARKLKGLTQEELAEQSNVNIRTIQRIENSENDPRGKTLQLICEVLQINMEDLLSIENEPSKNVGVKIVNSLFLLSLNFLLMGVVGYLTLDSNANMNSRFAAMLLSVLIPLFIVFLTKKMSSFERLFKFGFGYIAYFVLIMILHSFAVGFVSGLFPCMLISIVILYFGNEFNKIIQSQH